MGRGSDYGNSMYRQLQEIMGRLGSVEKDLKIEKREHAEDVGRLEKMIAEKDQKIQLLTDDNERLKRIINNDSSNSSLPPSSDQKGKSANTYNSREKSGKKPGAQPGHKGKALTKKDAEEKIKSSRFQHEISHVGKISEKYVTKNLLSFEPNMTPAYEKIQLCRKIFLMKS